MANCLIFFFFWLVAVHAKTDEIFRSNLVTKGQQGVNNFARFQPLLEEEKITNIPDSVCQRPFGLFPVVGSCRKYIHCRLGVAYTAECAPNTVFEIGK